MGNRRPSDTADFAFSPSSRRLTRMGHVAQEEDEACDVVAFSQIEIRGRPAVSGVLASFPVAEIKPVEVYAGKARKALGARTGRAT